MCRNTFINTQSGLSPKDRGLHFIAAGAAWAARISGIMKSTSALRLTILSLLDGIFIHRSTIDSIRIDEMSWFGDSMDVAETAWLTTTYSVAAILLWVSRRRNRRRKSASLTKS
jgi:hypothetical protein